MQRTEIFIFTLLITFTISSCQLDKKTPPTRIDQDIERENVSGLSGNIDRKEPDQRMTWQKPAAVIAALGNLQNKTIADLGAGIGYFSFKLLGKSEKVIAIDIDTEAIQMLNGFKRTMSEVQRAKFDVRLATPVDPNLKANEVDIIFIVNTVTFLSNREEYLSNLKQYLKPEGKIFIVDFKSKRLPNFIEAPDFEDRAYMHVLEQELENAGYKNIITDDTTLDFQYIISAQI